MVKADVRDELHLSFRSLSQFVHKTHLLMDLVAWDDVKVHLCHGVPKLCTRCQLSQHHGCCAYMTYAAQLSFKLVTPIFHPPRLTKEAAVTTWREARPLFSP